MTTPRAELVAQFCSELAKIGGAAHVARSKLELERLLIDFVHASGARQLVSFAPQEFEPFECSRIWSELPIRAWEQGMEENAREFRARAAAADIGLTIADLAIAATGSLLFRADARRPRSVSLLPRSHVVLLHARDLTPDLAHALDWLAKQGAPPSSAVFVTGPSRTSDIENDLTLGVHGPAAVTVFLLDE
ncbi:MAG TPA: LUD domain-containing protein [Planctomycetota bacterium]|nr:LUD domain-containing protein [Planctomycetota bacterium]